MLIGGLNLSGFPLITSGFWSKDSIMAEGFVTHGPGFKALGVLLVVTAGLTAYYTFRVYFRVFVGPVHFEPGDEVHGAHDEAHAHDDHVEDEERQAGAEPAKQVAHKDHGHAEHFHPHAPGWAINLVLVILALGSFAAIPLVLLPADTHGWVGGLVHHSTAAIEAHHAEAHASFWENPHQWMLVVSSVVGIFGILIAAWLHWAGRTEAATARADKLLPALGPIPRWAQNKWYVDEFYDWLIVTPLRVTSTLFYYFDMLIVDGLVNLVGWLPRLVGSALRPSQSGQLHGYAVSMAGGIGFLILIVLIVTRAAG
jgi:NADH-quinone oxidoreductase subunit L